ncbi:MAG: sugar ABC transporter permease [Oscillospiraceae bacterium]|nr:sugar ABC transporter permease [Oscillospiraceae bacterium]
MNKKTIQKDWIHNRAVYLMAIPIILYFLIWNYLPMVGIALAFEDYSARGGFLFSKWIGLKNFVDFFKSYYLVRLLRNTLILSVGNLIINFPAPIILALLLNELENQLFKKVIQTISYMPFFISVVVICGIIVDFFSYNGAFTILLTKLGLAENKDLMSVRSYFRPIYILSNTWQGVGYGSIIYLAALSGVDQELYEAAKIDGANRWQQTLHVTIPGIAPTIIIMLILQIGSLLSTAMEKILLLYRPLTYEVADTITTFVYRRGLIDGDFGYSTSVGLFNSFVNLLLLFIANSVSRKYSETSLF